MTDTFSDVVNENKAYNFQQFYTLQWKSGLLPPALLLSAKIVFVPLAYEQILEIGPLSNLHNMSTN